jgi:hypothetical protein
MNEYCGVFLNVSEALATLGVGHGNVSFQGDWSSINWMNTPGPIYGAETDNCCTGDGLAPNNVQLDGDGREVIFRQPVNLYEVRQVIKAADAEAFCGYGADGDSHWSYEKVKEWWARKHELEAEVERLYQQELALGEKLHYERYTGLLRWKDYVAAGLHLYLRVYSFFLEERRIPTAADTLPGV